MAILNVPAYDNQPGANSGSYLYLLTREQWEFARANFTRLPEIEKKMKWIFANPYETIRSIRIYPFDVETYATVWSTAVHFKLGDYDFTDIMGSVVSGITDFSPPIDMGAVKVEPWADSFLDYEPYSRIQLYLPYIGFATVKMNEVLGVWIHVYYVVDYMNGTATAYIVRQRESTPAADDRILSIHEGVIGLDVPLLSSNEASLANQQRIAEKQANAQTGITATTTAVTTTLAIIGAIAGFASGNVGVGLTSTAMAIGSTATGATSMIKTGVSKAATIAGLETHFGASGVPGGVSAWYAPQQVMLFREHVNAQIPSDFAEICGRPLEKTKTLSEVHGYTEIEQIHLLDFSSASGHSTGATLKEISEIEALLKSGVILPGAE